MRLIGWCLLAFSAAVARADVKLPAVLSSHMVLQREMPVPVWGQAAPGEKVTVKFRDQEKSTAADVQGKWSVRLDPLKAGGPDPLTVRGMNTITLEDVLVGEVWIGSGQSNMSGITGRYGKDDPVLTKLAEKSYPTLRLLTSGRPGWETSNPKSNAEMSAIMFAFGIRVQEALDVPVGVMVGAVGGTPSGFWLTEEMLSADAPAQAMIQKANTRYNFAAEKQKQDAKIASWEKSVEQAKKDNKPLPRKPLAPAEPGKMAGKIGNLYEKHIQPYAPFAVRGVVWDQGESKTQITGVDQYTVMGALIRGWRKAWGQDLPFIIIQKPSGGGIAYDSADPVTKEGEKFTALPAMVPVFSAGDYRDQHIRLTSYPNVGLAIASDLGPMTHPINKSGYATRAARVALGMTYGKKIEYNGPTYKSHTIEGDKVRITFTHVGQGLTFKPGEKLQGFAIAGEDRNFVWADAVIDGETVVLSHAKVSKPIAVRYAFSNAMTWANFFNKDGLPAVSFRTDTWEK